MTEIIKDEQMSENSANDNLVAETKQFEVKAIVSFEVELLVEAENEDDAYEYVLGELIHCHLSTNTYLQVVNDFAGVDVRRVEEV